YTYHIHQKPVPETGNCTATGGHFDPFNRTSNATCTSSTLDQCEVGDLSDQNGTVAAFQFVDPTVHLSGNLSVLNRSVVIHDPTGARIACASI
ncbi:superoxide dismutase, partial [Thamnocephalis sphaerospora]